MTSPQHNYRHQPRRSFRREFKREMVEILLEQSATVAEAAVLLSVELVEVRGAPDTKTSMTVDTSETSQRLRRLRVVLPKGQLQLEDVHLETLRLLIEVLK